MWSSDGGGLGDLEGKGHFDCLSHWTMLVETWEAQREVCEDVVAWNMYEAIVSFSQSTNVCIILWSRRRNLQSQMLRLKIAGDDAAQPTLLLFTVAVTSMWKRRDLTDHQIRFIEID